MKPTELPPFTHDLITVESKKGKVAVRIAYKSRKGTYKIQSYTVERNGHKVYDSKNHKLYVKVWSQFLDDCVPQKGSCRVLIVNGGDQSLSNILIQRYPDVCFDITVVDKTAYLFLQEDIKHALKATAAVNAPNLKFLALDMDLMEAMAEEILEPDGYDLILVQGEHDVLGHFSGMYEPQYVDAYVTLLRESGDLIINHNYTIKRLPKEEPSPEVVKLIQDDIKYHLTYERYLDAKLCQVGKGFTTEHKICHYNKIDSDVKVGWLKNL